MLKIIKQNMRELNEASVFTFNITEIHKSYTTKSRLRAIFHTWRKRKKNVSEKKCVSKSSYLAWEKDNGGVISTAFPAGSNYLSTF